MMTRNRFNQSKQVISTLKPFKISLGTSIYLEYIGSNDTNYERIVRNLPFPTNNKDAVQKEYFR